MNLQPRAIILIVLDAFGGRVESKTLLQKRLYFIEVLLKKDLSLGFGPHFYGPYSAVLNSELTTLKVQGQVREDTAEFGYFGSGGFEMRRYSYQLTEAGKSSVQWIQSNYAADCEQIREAAQRISKAGDLDYIDLSFAAKAHWVLRAVNCTLSNDDISREASHFGWRVRPDKIETGVRFLRDVGLLAKSEGSRV